MGKSTPSIPFGPVMFSYMPGHVPEDKDIIEIMFLHTDTCGAIHRKDIPLLIGALEILRQCEKLPESPCIDASSLVSECDKNA